jgi:hypothetical protein
MQPGWVPRVSEVALSPILVRPVREQLEHDRVIRLLQTRYKRKYEVGTNIGAEQLAPVGTGPSAIYPDLVLWSSERNRKLLGVVEVETSESINHLEAMSQWAALGRLRAPFYLYVPAGSIDTTRRLCADHQIAVTEIWTFHAVGDEIRFTMIMRSPDAAQPKIVDRVPTVPSRRVAVPARRKSEDKPRARNGRPAAKRAPGRTRLKASKGKKAPRAVRAQKRK